MTIKFQKHYVQNAETKAKCRVWYSLDNRADGRKCVTIYAKDYGGELGAILGDSYINDSDLMSDYFDKGRAVLFEGHPLYAAARARAEAEEAERSRKFSQRQSAAAMSDVNYVGHPCHY